MHKVIRAITAMTCPNVRFEQRVDHGAGLKFGGKPDRADIESAASAGYSERCRRLRIEWPLPCTYAPSGEPPLVPADF
jgi:hypothetical protein